MRKIIAFTVLCLVFALICSLLSMRSAEGITNLASFAAALKSLAPTEAEAKAALEWSKKRIARNNFNGEKSVPSKAEPVDAADNGQIALKYCFVSVPESLAQMIIDEPALSWHSILNQRVEEPVLLGSSFPVHQDALKVKFSGQFPGQCAVGTHTPTPIQVRFLEKSNTDKFLSMVQGEVNSSVLTAPKLVFLSGESGSISDCTQQPFVTDAIPVISERETAYQPVITVINMGLTLQCKATLIQDDSCLLNQCETELVSVSKVDTFTIAGSEGKTSIKIQIPTVQSLKVTIPEITVPKEMSLLVALPGVKIDSCYPGGKKGKSAFFILVSPSAVHPPKRDLAAK